MAPKANKSDIFGDAPFTDPSDCCSLPSHGKVDSDSTPNQLRMDKAIEARYGKPTDDMTGMKPTGLVQSGFRTDDGEDGGN